MRLFIVIAAALLFACGDGTINGTDDGGIVFIDGSVVDAGYVGQCEAHVSEAKACRSEDCKGEVPCLKEQSICAEAKLMAYEACIGQHMCTDRRNDVYTERTIEPVYRICLDMDDAADCETNRQRWLSEVCEGRECCK